MWNAIPRSRTHIPRTTISQFFVSSPRSRSRSFTTFKALRNPRLEPQPQPKSKPKSSENPGPMPTAGFKDLGATRTVKIVVITCLSIAGTMESIFWFKMLWAKYGPVGDVEAGIEEKSIEGEGKGENETSEA
ncbi:hypothetical protein ACMFMG_007924 [Clarireedia jacksonii]